MHTQIVLHLILYIQYFLKKRVGLQVVKNVTGPAKVGHVVQTTPHNITGYISVLGWNICIL